MNGMGKLTRSDGSSFEGEFKEGKRHGRGVETLNGGRKCEGVWRGDELQKNVDV